MSLVFTTAPAEVRTKPAAAPQPKLIGIQYLRALAAMMIVVLHLDHQLRGMGYTGPWLSGLSGGVDIFFVISGFIMWVTTVDRPVTPLQFWSRRIARVVPLYWLLTSFLVLVMVVAPQLLQTARFDLSHVIGSYLFLPVIHPATGLFQPVVIPGWTLQYEMLFYLVFGAFLFTAGRARFYAPVVVLMGLVALGAALRLDAQAPLAFWTSDLLMEFAFGMALGWAATRRRVMSEAAVGLGWLLLAGGMAAILLLAETTASLPRSMTAGLSSVAVVAGVLVLEARGKLRQIPVLHLLGDASYSIYLTHVVTLSAMGQAWRRLGLDASPAGLAMFCLAAVLVSTIAGVICYGLVERPLNRHFGVGVRTGAKAQAAL